MLLSGIWLSCDLLLQMLICGSSVGREPSVHIAALNKVKCDNIDNLVARFPPCMRHLHNCLRRNHRLKHTSRVRAVNIHELQYLIT